MSLSYTVFIDRANRAVARSTFDNAAATMKASRQSVFIFPEGTRSYAEEPTLLPFKKGAFHMAIQAGVPIVPVVMRNAGELLAPRAKVVRPGTIDVAVLEPIDTSDWTADDLNTIVPGVRQLFVDTLEKWPS